MFFRCVLNDDKEFALLNRSKEKFIDLLGEKVLMMISRGENTVLLG